MQPPPKMQPELTSKESSIVLKPVTPKILVAKVTTQQYDDIVNRNFERQTYLDEQTPGNGD